jgi:hypothetical protein
MTPRIGKPETFGWLRHPDADKPLLEAWELPCGQIRFVPRGMSFCVVKDAESTRIKPMMTKARR